MSILKTPIEAIADIISDAADHVDICDVVVDQVLVPEQCMVIYINGQPFHVEIEPMIQVVS